MSYESDVEAALASIKLAEDADRAQDRASRYRSLIIFLESHPEFKEFYNLLKAVE